MKRKIKAEIIAGSLNEHGQKITTWVLTYPRFIHAECKTHRIITNDDSYYEDISLMNDVNFSRNAASSRAIPSLKMIKDVEEDPFIPVAWQKEHKGMQGTEYHEGAAAALLENDWLAAKDAAVSVAEAMADFGCTKQLTNRLLEPFQWYTAIFTTTETENFFNLRCPQYAWDGQEFRSRADCLIEVNKHSPVHSSMNNWDDLSWLKINKGQGEIHISLLAEAMWDSMNEYDYKQLSSGEWHIPFGDKIDSVRLDKVFKAGSGPMNRLEARLQIATARCARVSYNNFEGKDDYEADLDLYNSLLTRPYTNKKGFTFTESDPKHMSPSEHCAKAGEDDSWSGNFRGFVQLRQTL